MHESDHKYSCTLSSCEWSDIIFIRWRSTAGGWCRLVDICQRIADVCTLHKEQEVLFALTTMNTSYWNATPCSLVKMCRWISFDSPHGVTCPKSVISRLRNHKRQLFLGLKVLTIGTCHQYLFPYVLFTSETCNFREPVCMTIQTAWMFPHLHCALTSW